MVHGLPIATGNDGNILVLDYHCNQCGTAWQSRPEWRPSICPNPLCGDTDWDKPKYWLALIAGAMQRYTSEEDRDEAVDSHYSVKET